MHVCLKFAYDGVAMKVVSTIERRKKNCLNLNAVLHTDRQTDILAGFFLAYYCMRVHIVRIWRAGGQKMKA